MLTAPNAAKKVLFLCVLFVPNASAPALTAATEPFPPGWR